MRKVGDLMKAMGFRPEGSIETKKAFIKYLGKISNNSKAELDFLNDCAPDEWKELNTHREPEQLSFDMNDKAKAG